MKRSVLIMLKYVPAALQPPCGLDCWAEYVNKLLKGGFFDCKNSFYVKTFMLLKQWKIRLMNTKRIPQDSAWNFDSDIIWVGLINAYSVCHIITYPSRELCSKMALGEVGLSLPWWCDTLVLPSPGYSWLFLNLIIFS